MEFWRYYRIIRRRRWLIIAGMVICVGAVALSNQLADPMFTGRTTLMESKGMSREGISPFPEQFMQVDVQLRLSNLANIATSNKVIVNAAQTLSDLGLRYEPQEIFQHTSVQPVRDTNILAIEVTLPDPEEAKIAADVIAAEFKKVYADLNTQAVTQSREFIAAQIEATRQAMVKAQNALRDYKEKNSLVDLNQQTNVELQVLAQAKQDRNMAQVGYERAKAQVEAAKRDLAALPEWQTASQMTSRNPIWERLKEQLVDLEVRRAGMLNGLAGQPRRGPKHPDVVAITEQIKDINAKLLESKEDYKRDYISSTSEARNPNYSNALDRWLNVKIEEVGQDAHRIASAAVLEAARAELSEMPAHEAKLMELQTDVQAAVNTYGQMRTKLDEARIKEQQAKSETALHIIDPAHVFPVNQRQTLKLILALLLSPLLGVGVALLLHYTDNTVKNAAEAEKLIGLPVLAAVPASRAHCLPRQRCPEVMDIAYQMLTSNLWIASQNQGVNSVAIVSADPDTGRSITAANLATSLAREGARVVLVDADLRQPSQHLIFSADAKIGLTNVLSGAATLEDALIPTREQGLLLMPAGPECENPVKLLRSPEVKALSDQVKELADFVVYDTPAGVAFPDPVLVATHVGNAVMVHSAGRVPRGTEPEFRERLESVGVRLLGTVLNRVKKEDSSGYFHYYRSYSGAGIARLTAGKKAIKN